MRGQLTKEQRLRRNTAIRARHSQDRMIRALQTHQTCTTCKVSKLIEDFALQKKSVTRRRRCKVCTNQVAKMWRIANPQRARAISQACRVKPEKRQREREGCRLYAQQHKQAIRARGKARRDSSPHEKLRISLRGRMHALMREGKYIKQRNTLATLGCTLVEAKRYIESLFEEDMSWDNYGEWRMGKPMTWHYDHIIPCSAYDLFNPEDEMRCLNWRNLRPAWAQENMIKSDRIDMELIKRYGIEHLLPRALMEATRP